MKRHQSFVPLSQDHYDGLLLAVRLQQGKQALERLWSHDPAWQANYVAEFFASHLAPHFEAEEMVVFSVAQKHLPDNPLVNQLIAEHEEMRMFAEYFRKPATHSLPGKLVQFGELLERHIRCEEREFFPLCESSLPREVLEKMKEPILQYKPANKDH